MLLFKTSWPNRFLAHFAGRPLAILVAACCLLAAPALAGGDHQHGEHKENGESAVALTNKVCPVTDEPVDPEIWVEHEGRRVYLCCGMCKKQFLEDPAAYMPKLAAETASSHDGHDDKKNRAEPKGFGGRLLRFGGRFHPLAVHFPIALLIAAFVAEILAWLRPKSEAFRHAARFCLWLGALGAVVAASLGWASAAFSNYPTLQDVLGRHRFLGTGGAILAVATLALREVAERRSKESSKLRKAYLFSLAATTVFICCASHFGGILIYGRNFPF